MFLLFGSVSVGNVVIGLGVVITLAGAIVLLGIRVSPGVVVIGASVGIGVGIFANFWCSLALVLFLLSLVSALVLALVLVLVLALDSIKSLIRPRNESVMQKSKNLDRNQFQLFCGDKKNISRK